MDFLDDKNKQRIVQELVPGKQITLAHIIASPDKILYEKLGLNPAIDYARAAIGIMTVSPAETAIIMADVAMKAAAIDLGFVDRFSGSLIITGTVSEVEASETGNPGLCAGGVKVHHLQDYENVKGEELLMKKLILMGRSESGKTTLKQALNGEKVHYYKTQYVHYNDVLIDTPGEYAQTSTLAMRWRCMHMKRMWWDC